MLPFLAIVYGLLALFGYWILGYLDGTNWIKTECTVINITIRDYPYDQHTHWNPVCSVNYELTNTTMLNSTIDDFDGRGGGHYHNRADAIKAVQETEYDIGGTYDCIYLSRSSLAVKWIDSDYESQESNNIVVSVILGTFALIMGLMVVIIGSKWIFHDYSDDSDEERSDADSAASMSAHSSTESSTDSWTESSSDYSGPNLPECDWSDLEIITEPSESDK